MRKSVTILLTLILPPAILGLALAVPHGALPQEVVERHKTEYQPEEFDFLLDLGRPAAPARRVGEDGGIDFGDEGDPGVDFGGEEDYGIDFGDEEDYGIDFGDEEDYGIDFGDEDYGIDFGDE